MQFLTVGRIWIQYPLHIPSTSSEDGLEGLPNLLGLEEFEEE